MALPRHTSVDRAVDRDAIRGQWAAHDDKVLKAATRRWLLRGYGGRSLRYHDVVGRCIRRVRGASESEDHRCGNTKFFHVAPRPVRLACRSKFSAKPGIIYDSPMMRQSRVRRQRTKGLTCCIDATGFGKPPFYCVAEALYSGGILERFRCSDPLLLRPSCYASGPW